MTTKLMDETLQTSSAPQPERVLIVEDDPATRSGLAELVQAWGFQTEEAPDGEEASGKSPASVPRSSSAIWSCRAWAATTCCATLKDQLSDITFILLTAQGTVESAVEAIKDGAYDYLSKPVDPQRLQILLKKAVERQETLREVRQLRRQLREHGASAGSSATARSSGRLSRDRAGGADARPRC